jgi:hypothetical protein
MHTTEKRTAAELTALQAIASLGHATAAQLAPLVYPNQTPESARTSAHRLLKRLTRARLLLRRTDGVGRTRYVLTSAGARTSGEAWARAGYNLRMHTAYKSDPLHDLLISYCNEGEIPRGAAMVRANVVPGAPAGVDGVIQKVDGSVVGVCARDVHDIAPLLRKNRHQSRTGPCLSPPVKDLKSLGASRTGSIPVPGTTRS